MKPLCGEPRQGDFTAMGLSANNCSPFSASAGVRLSYLNGDPVGFRGETVPLLDRASRGIGEIVPLGGTGILISSGDDGIISCGRPAIVILEASLL